MNSRKSFSMEFTQDSWLFSNFKIVLRDFLQLAKTVKSKEK